MKVHNSKGFTLIELIVVIVIIGILAAVAVPAFQNLLLQARAGAARGCLGAIRSAVVISYAASGAVAGNPVWPAGITTVLFADNRIPVNPIVNLTNSDAGAPPTAEATLAVATTAWRYSQATGSVFAYAGANAAADYPGCWTW